MSGNVRIVLNTSGIQNIQRALRSVSPRYVADGVNYGIHQEYGTYRIAAHPFVRPGVENVRAHLPQSFGAFGMDQLDDALEKIATDVQAQAAMLAPVDTGALRNSIHVTKDRPE